jgi:hypothetical protein
MKTSIDNQLHKGRNIKLKFPIKSITEKDNSTSGAIYTLRSDISCASYGDRRD